MSMAAADATPDLPTAHAPSIVVIGGAGRVGWSAVRHILEFAQECGWAPRVVVAGRSEAAFRAAVRSWRRQSDGSLGAAGVAAVRFAPVDAADGPALDALLHAEAPDLVIHAAGPFQGQTWPMPLAACLRHGVPRYLDVCDDIPLCAVARQYFHDAAVAAGATCAIGAGVWPGVSNLMAAACLEALPEGSPGERARVVFDFYTAGTGGAGAAVLAATFLLLAEDATVVRGGRREGAPPYEPKPVALGGPEADFGPSLGPKPVYRMNLLEPVAIAETSPAVGDAECFFGTDPPVWNALMGAVVRWVPRPLLANRAAMQAVGRLSAPVVQMVDALVGSATNAMRVTTTRGPHRAEAAYVHPRLEDCVGASVAAFALYLLDPATSPPAGVLYPDELCDSPAARKAVFRWAAQGCADFRVPDPTGSL